MWVEMDHRTIRIGKQIHCSVSRTGHPGKKVARTQQAVLSVSSASRLGIEPTGDRSASVARPIGDAEAYQAGAEQCEARRLGHRPKNGTRIGARYPIFLPAGANVQKSEDVRADRKRADV